MLKSALDTGCLDENDFHSLANREMGVFMRPLFGVNKESLCQKLGGPTKCIGSYHA